VLLLGKKIPYIGMIGSRKRVESIKRRLEAEGIARSVLDELHAPIGLEIGATSPREIAVSIVAEIIGEFRRSGLACS
jgi:xanthine dehydrogenase accessory factor